MKKIVFSAILIISFVFSSVAFASPYTDDANKFVVDIPEETNLYYYTPEGSNMSEELLNTVNPDNQDVRFSLCAYTDSKELAYSIKMTAAALSTLFSDTQGTVSPADPAASVLPAATGLETVEIGSLTEEQIATIINATKTEYGADYSFGDASFGNLGNKKALVLQGNLSGGIVNTTKIYFVVNNGILYTVTAIYKNDDQNTHFNSAAAILNTLQFGTDSVPAAVTVQPATPSPSPSATVPAASQTMETVQPEATGFFNQLGANLQNMYLNDPNFLYYIICIMVLIALLIILIILLKSGIRKKRNALSSEAEPEKTAIAEDPTATVDQNAQQNHRSRSVERAPFGDISRYTQKQEDALRQPAESAQDPAQPTVHQESPTPASPQTRIAHVGSRVERNRQKKNQKRN